MKTITLSEVSDALHSKLEARAKSHGCTVEEEALHRLQKSVQDEELVLAGIPAEKWPQIEESLVMALNDSASEMTEADIERYRQLAQGNVEP